jgi:ribose transport system substrate-binding protein
VKSGRHAHRRGLMWLSALLALAVGLVFAGCGGDDSSGDGDSGAGASKGSAPKVGLVLPDYTQNELILGAKEGAEAAAKEEGVDLTVAKGSGDTTEQVRSIEDMVTSQVDVIVYDAIDEKGVGPAIQAANEAGVKIVCIVSCTDEGDHAARIDFDYEKEMGVPTGEWLAKVAPDAKKIGFVDSNQVNPAVKAMYDGAKSAFTTAGIDPKMEISPPTDWDKGKALNVARDFLTANPDLGALMCMHDLIAGACLDAMRELGYKDIPIGGEGGTCEGLNNIVAGRQDFTVIQDLHPAGAEGVRMAKTIAEGGTVPETKKFIPMAPVTTEILKNIQSGSQEGVINGVDVKALLDNCQKK